MTRDDALKLLSERLKNKNLFKHCLAVEACLRRLARRLGENEDIWGLAGLLHDLDVEITQADLSIHGQKTVEILTTRGLDPEIINAIAVHNEQSAGRRRQTVFEHALAAGETITGLIIATTLVYPDKRLSSVKPKSVVKRMKEKAFAASVNRDIIRECEQIGIPLPEFAEICVQAMQGISSDLGL